MDAKTRHGIALDYWFFIALALLAIIWGTLKNGVAPADPVYYFIATAFIIHAHGNRIRATLIALHALTITTITDKDTE
jgi:hypothetical protein